MKISWFTCIVSVKIKADLSTFTVVWNIQKMAPDMTFLWLNVLLYEALNDLKWIVTSLSLFYIKICFVYTQSIWTIANISAR